MSHPIENDYELTWYEQGEQDEIDFAAQQAADARLAEINAENPAFVESDFFARLRALAAAQQAEIVKLGGSYLPR